MVKKIISIVGVFVDTVHLYTEFIEKLFAEHGFRNDANDGKNLGEELKEEIKSIK